MTTIPPQSGSYPSDNDLVLLSTYIDGELEPVERDRLEQRLESEPLLRQELESLRETTVLLQELPPIQTPRSFTLDPATTPRRRSVLAFWGRGQRGIWQMSGLAAALVLALWVTGAVLLSQGGGMQTAAVPERASGIGQQDDAAAAEPAAPDALPALTEAPPEETTGAAVAMEEAAEAEEAEVEEAAEAEDAEGGAAAPGGAEADAEADAMVGAVPEARATATRAPTQALAAPPAPQMTAPAEQAVPAEGAADEAAMAEEEAPASESELALPTETIEGPAGLDVDPTDIAAADTLASETEDLAQPEPSPPPAAPGTTTGNPTWIGIAALVLVVLVLAAGAWFVIRRNIRHS
jgi:hypothetical protein